jgi:hypothetical protein
MCLCSRKTHGENKIFDVMGITCEDDWEQEVIISSFNPFHYCTNIDIVWPNGD